jgi:hypothetical protein
LIIAVSRATFVFLACLGTVELRAREHSEILARGNRFPGAMIASSTAVETATLLVVTIVSVFHESFRQGSPLPSRRIA